MVSQFHLLISLWGTPRRVTLNKGTCARTSVRHLCRHDVQGLLEGTETFDRKAKVIIRIPALATG